MFVLALGASGCPGRRFLASGDGGMNGSSLLGRRRNAEEVAGFVGVLPTVSTAGDVLSSMGFLKRLCCPVDGTKVPMLEGGITSSLYCTGVLVWPSRLTANTSL